MFCAKSRQMQRILWSSVILIGIVGLLNPAGAAFAQTAQCGTRGAPKCPPTQRVTPVVTDGRLNTNLADPYDIYCLDGQVQIYKINALGQGNLFNTHPINDV